MGACFPIDFEIQRSDHLRSCNCLVAGTWPALDHTGTEFAPGSNRHKLGLQSKALCAGLEFAFTSVHGDWKWLKEAFHLQENWAREAVCDLCEACKSRGEMFAYNFEEDARVRACVCACVHMEKGTLALRIGVCCCHTCCGNRRARR